MNPSNFKIIDLKRIMYFVVFVLMLVITEYGRFIYRPYIYKFGINDFGLADSIGNFGGIIVQIFFGLAVLNPVRKKAIHLILIFVFGYILYEIFQPLFPGGIFDWKDIAGTILGGLIGFGLFLILSFKNKLNKVIFSLE